MELTFKSGNVELSEHIPYKKENLAKIRLIRDGDTEGVWAMLSTEGKALYNDDEIYDTEIIAVLCNPALAGVPWGSYIKINLDGMNRPTCICEDQFEDGHIFQYADWAIAQITEGMLKDLQDGKYKIDEPGLKEYLIGILKQAPESDVTEVLKSLLEQ